MEKFVLVFILILEIFPREDLAQRVFHIPDGRCRQYTKEEHGNFLYKSRNKCVSNISCFHTVFGLTISWIRPMDNDSTVNFLVFVSDVTVNGGRYILLDSAIDSLKVLATATYPRIDVDKEYSVTVTRRSSERAQNNYDYSTSTVCAKGQAATKVLIEKECRTNKTLWKSDPSQMENNTPLQDVQILYGIIGGLSFIILLLIMIIIAVIYKYRKALQQMSNAGITSRHDRAEYPDETSLKHRDSGDKSVVYSGISQRKKEDNDHIYTGIK